LGFETANHHTDIFVQFGRSLKLYDLKWKQRIKGQINHLKALGGSQQDSIVKRVETRLAKSLFAQASVMVT
jgi:hypothetical protein